MPSNKYGCFDRTPTKNIKYYCNKIPSSQHSIRRVTQPLGVLRHLRTRACATPIEWRNSHDSRNLSLIADGWSSQNDHWSRFQFGNILSSTWWISTTCHGWMPISFILTPKNRHYFAIQNAITSNKHNDSWKKVKHDRKLQHGRRSISNN